MVFATGTKAPVGVQDASSLQYAKLYVHLSHVQCSWVPKDLKNTSSAWLIHIRKRARRCLSHEGDAVAVRPCKVLHWTTLYDSQSIEGSSYFWWILLGLGIVITIYCRDCLFNGHSEFSNADRSLIPGCNGSNLSSWAACCLWESRHVTSKSFKICSTLWYNYSTVHIKQDII